MHKHHIVPKHMGGTDDPSNIVELSIEQHALAHKQLYEQFGHWQDRLAYRALSGQLGKEEIIKEAQGAANRGRKKTEEEIEKLKKSCSERTARWLSNPDLWDATNEKRSATMKKFVRENPEKRINSNVNLNWVGRKHKEETKAKLREINLGKKIPKEVIEKRSATLKAKGPIRRSEETKAKLRAAWIIRKRNKLNG